MAKDLGKNLDIWKDTTLFDVTEENNLRIIVSPHQNMKKKLKRELEMNVKPIDIFPSNYYMLNG